MLSAGYPRIRLYRLSAVFAWCAPVALLAPFAVLFAVVSVAAPMTVEVVASGGLPGFPAAALSRFIARHMAEAGLADWRFVTAADHGVAADRVEWSFKFNPYAGGEVRSFMHSLSHASGAGAGRPMTIEARLYLNGAYWTLVEAQATVGSGPDDPDLAAAVVSATRNLLGSSGAYRAIDLGRHPANPKN
jgi:hypothetical protein